MIILKIQQLNIIKNPDIDISYEDCLNIKINDLIIGYKLI